MKFLLNIFLLFFISATGLHATSGQLDFKGLLDEAGMAYEQPEAFSAIQIQPNALLSYEHAIRHKDGQLEIRYIIRPIKRLEIEYNDPHNPAPNPNDMFHMLFETLSGRLSGGRYNPDRTWPPSEANKLFHADWAAVSAFDVERPFSKDYKEALFLAIHKDHHADAYVAFLYNDFDKVRELVKQNLSSLVFLPGG